MAFTRSFLKAAGLNDEQIASIMEEHVSVVDGLKKDRDGYKADAEKLATVQAELDKLKSGEDYKSKWESEHNAFEQFKKDTAAAAQLEKVKAAYRKLLTDEHISEKRHDGIIRLTDFSKIKLDADGNLENVKALKDQIGTEWGEYRVKTEVRHDHPGTPPKDDNGGGGVNVREMTAKWHAARYGAKETAQNNPTND